MIWDMLWEPSQMPFAVALVMLVILLAWEVISISVGTSIHVHADVDVDADLSAGFADAILTWCHLGRLPFLVILVLLLMGFSIGGYVVQWASVALLGQPSSLLIAVPLAVLCAILTLRSGGKVARAILPRDETSAVSTSTFIGRTAIVTQGRATVDLPAEAKLVDAYGQAHYIRVIPDAPNVILPEGCTVLVLSQDNAVFTAALVPGDPP